MLTMHSNTDFATIRAAVRLVQGRAVAVAIPAAVIHAVVTADKKTGVSVNGYPYFFANCRK